MAELSSCEEDVLSVGLLLCDEEEEEEEIMQRKRSFWVHPINQKRRRLGEFYHLYPDLEKDPKKYFQYFRMTQCKFSELLDIIRPHLEYQNTKFRRAVSPEERLAVCLR